MWICVLYRRDPLRPPTPQVGQGASDAEADVTDMSLPLADTVASGSLDSGCCINFRQSGEHLAEIEFKVRAFQRSNRAKRLLHSPDLNGWGQIGTTILLFPSPMAIGWSVGIAA
jgi:hypothetical protein